MFLSTYELEHGCHVARLHHRRRRRRRRRAYAPTSNTASHDTHEKSIHGFPFFPLYGYGAPLGGLRPPELRYKHCVKRQSVDLHHERMKLKWMD